MTKRGRRNGQDALRYHSEGRPGKIEVVSTKPVASQLDLSLAYTPGVAAPCREIAADPEKVNLYTARRNLVAVVSNGTRSEERRVGKECRSGCARHHYKKRTRSVN